MSGLLWLLMLCCAVCGQDINIGTLDAIWNTTLGHRSGSKLQRIHTYIHTYIHIYMRVHFHQSLEHIGIGLQHIISISLTEDNHIIYQELILECEKI